MNYKIKSLLLLVLCLTMASVVCADTGHSEVSGDLDVTYHGLRTEIGQQYPISFVYEDQTYYVDNDNLNKLASSNEDFEYLFKYDANFKSPYLLVEGNDLEFDRQCNNTDFSFDYETGQTVGNDTNASVVTNVYSPDGSELEKFELREDE